ncbi:MAG: RND family efflux transporter MFP subunit [Oceanicoccus sp.]
MPSNLGTILRPVIIITIACLIATGLYFNRDQPVKAELKQTTLLVDVAEVVKEDIRISVSAQGTISPSTETLLIAEVTGRIIEVAKAFKVGGFFNQGDVLLRIDQRDYLTDLKRAEAAVASAESEQASEQGIAEVAYKDWIKYRSSVKRTQAAEDLALRKPQLAHAKAKLDSALADLDHAKDQLDRTTIRAPYNGLVRNKQVDIGQYVNAGSELATTFAIDFAELRMALPDNKLNYLELPTLVDRDFNIEPKVEIYAEIGGQLQQWQAKLVRTEGVMDERSRVLFVVAEIADPYGLSQPQAEELRIGTFVKAKIEGRLINDLVRLPRHVLRPGNVVWVIDQQQRLQNRKVSLLRTSDREIYITAGLDQGDLVPLSTIRGGIPGTAVRIASKTATNAGQTLEPTLEAEPQKQQPTNLAPALPADKLTREGSHPV